jgi:hypothetical protein
VALRVKETEELIDQVTYGKSTDGHAFSLDPAALDATLNDDQAAWCAAESPYGSDGAYGTPGAANPTCGASGCDDGAGGTRELRLPEAGELVITEILSNTPGAEDHALEWVEVYNPTEVPLDLLGVELLYGATCQSASALSGSGCLTIPAGGYAVLAGSADPALNGGITPLATFGGTGLRNDAGCVGLRVQETGVVVDQATYGTSTDGVSFSLDPNKLDATLNDDQATWCQGTATFGTAGGFGTPGAANSPCAAAGCDDGAGGTRAVRVPAAGELVISEVMSNSPGAEDHAKEWFEVYNTTAEAIDLVGVEVLYGATCQSATAVVGTGCITVPPAGYAVVAGSADPLANGGVAALASFAGAGLRNDDGCLALRVKATQEVVDQVAYGTSTDGKAFSLDPNHLDAVANDTAANWCLAGVTYGTDGGYGTPGAANPACGVTYCNDASTPRAAVAPAVGTVFVTEVFANPAGADTPEQEWLELRVTQDCDLNGLRVTNGNGTSTRVWTLSSADCLHVAADSYVVVAGSVDPLANGGLPTTGIYAIGNLSLYNSDATLTLEAGGETIDAASYPSPPEGQSVSLDPTQLTAAGNDSATSFCASTTTTVFSGTGTPGQANDTCP